MTIAGAGSTPGIAAPVKSFVRVSATDPPGSGHDQERHAANKKHRRQRDHNRLQPQECDEEAIERADRHADGEAGRHGRDLAAGAVLGNDRDDRIDQRDGGASREIEAADDDHEGLADRGERQGVPVVEQR